MKNTLLRTAAASAIAAPLLAGNAFAEDACGLCVKEIVTNSELATCFLDQYDQIARSGSGAVVVDLSDCGSRGIVEALPSPSATSQQPDVQFMLSRVQLDCLKHKLQEPGLVLDPSAKIELDTCG